MRLRNTTTKYISCIGCEYYDFGLCKKIPQILQIHGKTMYPLASDFRKICGYKIPKYYVSIDLKYLEEQIDIQHKLTRTTLFIIPISTAGMFIGLEYNCHDMIFLSCLFSFYVSNIVCIYSISSANLYKERLKRIIRAKHK